MAQNYLGVMSLVKRFEKPGFFITMTANPSWPEITNELRWGETAANRPDLMARVFRIKLQVLLDKLLREHVLGVAIGYTWVIEFQKRGLPHGHLLLIVHPDDKPRTPEHVDQVICAELPDGIDPDQHELWKTISQCQVHGPCGQFNPSAPCMEDGVCTKGYPKDFNVATALLDGMYPRYKRRDAGRHVKRHSHHALGQIQFQMQTCAANWILAPSQVY